MNIVFTANKVDINKYILFDELNILINSSFDLLISKYLWQKKSIISKIKFASLGK